MRTLLYFFKICVIFASLKEGLYSSNLQAQSLVFEPRISNFLDSLYGRVASKQLNLEPFYEAAGIKVSDRACDPMADENATKACASAPCPLGKDLGLNISCFYNKHSGAPNSDLLVKSPYPPKILGDYNPDWNTYQFKAIELKLGGRLPTIGLVRTLSVPGHQRTGFYEFRRVDEALSGGETIERWRSRARNGGNPACGESLCFSIHQVTSPPEARWPNLLELLVECTSRKISNTIGSPEYCTPIYMGGNQGEFISAITSFREESMRVSKGLISASVFFEFKSKSPDFQVVSALIEKALSLKPLNLEISRDADAVVGVAAMRQSQIINNWYETATVRAILTQVPLTFSNPGEGTNTIIGVRVGLATTLFVNNRNTVDENEWRMPTSLQSMSFDKSIVDGIKAQAAAQCGNISFQTRDSVTIISCPTDNW